jgi:hypothetical protein
MLIKNSIGLSNIFWTREDGKFLETAKRCQPTGSEEIDPLTVSVAMSNEKGIEGLLQETGKTGVGYKEGYSHQASDNAW